MANPTDAGSDYVDDRDEQVTFKYNKLTIDCPTGLEIFSPVSTYGSSLIPDLRTVTAGTITNTVGVTTSPIYSFVAGLNQAYKIELQTMGYNLVGLPGGTLNQNTISTAKNVGGVITLTTAWNNVQSNLGPLVATGMSLSNVGSTVTVNLVQDATYSVRWVYNISIIKS